MVPFLLRSKTTLISFRVQNDVLSWLKSKGSGHLSRIKAILANVMDAEQRLSRLPQNPFAVVLDRIVRGIKGKIQISGPLDQISLNTRLLKYERIFQCCKNSWSHGLARTALGQ